MAENPTFSDHFSSFALHYATGRPTYPDDLYQFIADNAPSRHRAWDCATGNGQAAAGLSLFFDEVCATDASKAQIDNAVAGTNISYSVQAAEETNFPAGHFDAAVLRPVEHLWQKGNKIALNGYADIQLPFRRIDVPQFKMQCDWNLIELVKFISTWSALNKYVADHGSGILENLEQQLEKVWGNLTDNRIVDMKFYVLGWRKVAGM